MMLFPPSASSGLPLEAKAECSDLSGVACWLRWAGLEFDPFEPLDAAADPHLSEYLVGHHIFARAWGDGIFWVFAPAGGGKTALRITIAQACWVGQETNRPFPLPYVPPFLLWGHTHPSEEEQWLTLARMGTQTLFLAMAHRPHWFLQLPALEQQQIADTFHWNLPGPLPAYLDLCRQTGQVGLLREALDSALILRDPPDAATLREWCDALEAAVSGEPAPSPSVRWTQLLTVLRDILAFPAVYILADGFDGAPDSADNPAVVVDCLTSLLNRVEEWAREKVFLKAFLPVEALPILSERFPDLFTPALFATIQWSPDLLAEVIRRRVYVASRGAFGSLDAVSSPALRDIETILARAVIPLPREMLVLTRRVIEEHIQREGTEGLLKIEDVHAAINWYSRENPLTRYPF